ncbi:MAG: nucleoside transporter [Omnitrophica WOR_2 bacterium GWA2_45_18]|nr:MAG: nucleoside transporter [Omnitrophica WOR_2 bacterium GWA2_45_18]
MNRYNFISFLGIIILIALAFLFSTNRRKVNWHVVVWGLGLQVVFAWFLFVFPAGVRFFLWINDAVVSVMDSALAGARFVFGPLALPPGMTAETGERSVGFILAFQAFPSIIFFSALMSILYYYNIMTRLIKAFAHVFTKLMRVSGAESLCAASNIFVGVESALTIKPFLKDMTRSELCVVLTTGMATVSSNVLAVYVFSLQQTFPHIAGHLISASFLSAPAALLMSKILLPETESPKTLGEHVEPHVERENNLFEAVINGANTGVRLIVGIVALLIAVLGLVALLDQGVGFLGKYVNALFHLNFDWSLKGILGVLFYPLTVILGIPPGDAVILSKIIGERMVVTEVTAYQDLATAVAQGRITDMRAAVITTYALCGFAHVASMAIFIGGVSAIVPEKTRVLAQIGFRALIAATLACLLTACLAGVFFVQGSVLLGK